MTTIYYSDIRAEWRKGCIIAVEFQNSEGETFRAIVQKLPKNTIDNDNFEKVETVYGIHKYGSLFSFSSAVEAQKFINFQLEVV